MTVCSPDVADRLTKIEASSRPQADAQAAIPMRACMFRLSGFLGIRATPPSQTLQGLHSFTDWAEHDLLALAQALWAQAWREFQYVAVDLSASTIGNWVCRRCRDSSSWS